MSNEKISCETEHNNFKKGSVSIRIAHSKIVKNRVVL